MGHEYHCFPSVGSFICFTPFIQYCTIVCAFDTNILKHDYICIYINSIANIKITKQSKPVSIIVHWSLISLRLKYTYMLTLNSIHANEGMRIVR